MKYLARMACSNAIFDIATEHWHHYRRWSTANLDPNMIPILDRFNRLPGVISRYSCEGHPDTPVSGRRKHTRTWIRFIATLDGLPTALELYDRILKHPLGIGDRELYPHLRLSLCNEPVLIDDVEIYVPTFIVSLPANAPHLKEASLTILRDSVFSMDVP